MTADRASRLRDGDTTGAVVNAAPITTASYPQNYAASPIGKLAAFAHGVQAAREGKAIGLAPAHATLAEDAEWVHGWAQGIALASRRPYANPGDNTFRPQPTWRASPRSWARWSHLEVEALRAFHMEQLPVAHQAAALGRSKLAVRVARSRIGLR